MCLHTYKLHIHSLTKHFNTQTVSDLPTSTFPFTHPYTYMCILTFTPSHKHAQTFTQSHDHAHRFIHTGTQMLIFKSSHSHIPLIHAHFHSKSMFTQILTYKYLHILYEAQIFTQRRKYTHKHFHSCLCFTHTNILTC